MYKLVKKNEALKRNITDSKIVFDYLTKEDSEKVSLAIIENTGDFGEVMAEQNYLYYVLEGSLILKI